MPSKYANKKVTIDGYTFDSRKEGKRYNELKWMLKAGKITDLVLQPSFVLQDKFSHNGTNYRAIKYIADFKYKQDGFIHVEDVKPSKDFQTDMYKMKKKIFLKKYGDICFFKEIY